MSVDLFERRLTGPAQALREFADVEGGALVILFDISTDKVAHVVINPTADETALEDSIFNMSENGLLGFGFGMVIIRRTADQNLFRIILDNDILNDTLVVDDLVQLDEDNFYSTLCTSLECCPRTGKSFTQGY